MEKSVNNIDHTICTGCMMCSDVCKKSAISFKIEKGFWFPSVNSNLCVNCGLCVKKCPALHKAPSVSGPISCYGAKSRNETVRWNSTSGGFFSELAYKIIAAGGFVIGASYGKDNEILHTIESTKEGVEKLRQSKYAQSNTAGIYQRVLDLLKTDVIVLFCGTACHVEALKAFLGKEYTNLLTMDFVCLGICSPIVYRKYLDMMERKYMSKINRVWFKNKQTGWRSIGTQLDFANGKIYYRPGGLDLFMCAFVGDSIAMRKSCETCKFRKIPHNSDFTVADFWGVENVRPDKDDNKGLSAVFVNSEKGVTWFERIAENLDFFETTPESIINGNFSAVESKPSGKNRDAFLEAIESMPFEKAYSKYGTEYTGIKKIRKNISQLKRVVLNRIIKH